ncbi:Nucleotidyltransferase domain protein [compost metagenome]|jgi:predicted nucleotidyltransferase
MTRAELLIKLRDLKPWLAEQGLVNVRLFGSYARDEAGPDSDVDLLVDIARPMGLRFYSLAEDLSDILGRRVELLANDGLRNPYVRAAALRDSLAI